MAKPIVAEALAPLWPGRTLQHGDLVVIQPGKYVRGLLELPLDLGQIAAADQAGLLRFLTPHQRAAFLAALDPPRPRWFRRPLSIVR